MKRSLHAVVAAGLTLATVLPAPSAASASPRNGMDVKSYKLPYLQYPETGKARAQLRNGTVTWRRDRVEKRVWVTVSGQLRDSGPGDGHCARFELWSAARGRGDEVARTKECNGVWQSRSLAVGAGAGGRVVLALRTGGSSATSEELTNPWG
ncbi:hypothetical protein [Nonomuraea sp. NPDC046570]|uniref:hypothetical protein n=1 Tax=Nonomuraea sp. NPDC046570 TaxID=3155255 RepID=UPI0033CCAC14